MIETLTEHKPNIHKNAFVHKAAIIIGQVSIDEGASIWPGAVLRGDMGAIIIGKNTSIQDGSICHMTKDYSATKVGSNVTVGHNVILHGCVIEDECLIGMGSIILDNAHIGRGSFVAAGSLVTGEKVIPPGSFVLGSPAKIIRPVNDKEIMMIKSSVEHYLAVVKKYL